MYEDDKNKSNVHDIFINTLFYVSVISVKDDMNDLKLMRLWKFAVYDIMFEKFIQNNFKKIQEWAII